MEQLPRLANKGFQSDSNGLLLPRPQINDFLYGTRFFVEDYGQILNLGLQRDESHLGL